MDAISGPAVCGSRLYSGSMPPPKRRAPRRTVAAVAEDLTLARWAGGLARADERALAATIDWLELTGAEKDEPALLRARDLLRHYVARVCVSYRESGDVDRTTAVAASTLEYLLLRPGNDEQMASVVRRKAVDAARHGVSTDAVRHREDRLIREIADEVAADVEANRTDIPQTVEAALHQLAPIVVDVRQDLHDLLCVTYPPAPYADERERHVVESYYRNVMLGLGQLLVAASHLVEVGQRSPDLTSFEFGMANLGRRMVQRLFPDRDDRQFMREFTEAGGTENEATSLARLLSTRQGVEVNERWLAWATSCFPTCAFERTADVGYMCSPHALVTLLYDFEDDYLAAGFRAPNDGTLENQVRRHRQVH